jgi:Na+/glutamate symporter
MSIWGDIFSEDTLAGAAGGAAAGSSAGPWGALAGGVIGGGLGAYAHDKRQSAASGQVQNLNELIANLKSMSNTAYDQHIADTKKALNYFGPAEQAYSRFYGGNGQPAQTGQGVWGKTGI